MNDRTGRKLGSQGWDSEMRLGITLSQLRDFFDLFFGFDLAMSRFRASCFLRPLDSCLGTCEDIWNWNL